MGSKAIMFYGVLVAMLLLTSSEVPARDLAEETSKATEAEPAQYGGPNRCQRYQCRPRFCRCCGYPGDADFNEAETHN